MLSVKRKSIVESVLKNISFGRFLIILFIFVNSQIFNASNNNPMGVRGFQEVFNLLLLLFALIYLMNQVIRKNRGIYKIDAWVFLLILSMWLYSAIAAMATYGQPLLYGLIEERRILSFFIYFPLVYSLRNNYADIDDIFNFILIAAAVCSLLSFSIYYGYITPFQEIEFRAGQLRQNRYWIGHHYIALSVLYSSFLILHRQHLIRSIILILLGALTLILLVQTRQVLIGLLVSLFAIYLYVNSVRASRIIAIALIVPIVSIVFTFVPDIMERYLLLFSQIVSDNYLDASARALAYNAVIQDLVSGEIFGHGALSLMWNNGFLNIYGPNFFLTDIGLLGSLFKYGLVAILFYWVYYSIQFQALRPLLKTEIGPFILGWIIYLIVMLPVAAPIEYRGFLSGLLLGITVVLHRQKRAIIAKHTMHSQGDPFAHSTIDQSREIK